jgi:multidrug efflux system membrane fusion protein
MTTPTKSLALYPRKSRPRAFVAGFLFAGIAALGGCGKESAPAGRRGAGGPAPVVAGMVERKVAPLALEAIGSVEAIRTANVRAQVTGILQKVDFQEGREVKEGELLFEIDPRPFQNALRSAEAELQRAHVQVNTANAEAERYQALSEQGMVSKEQFQSIQSNQQTLQASLLVAESAVESDRLQLEYCSIRAPLTGLTGSLNVHEGDLIRASDPGAALVVINQLSPIYVTFSVSQQQIPVIARYRKAGKLAVKVTPGGAAENAVEGELTFFDNAIDSSTGTLKLKATFANEDHRLWPGQFVNVNLLLAAPEVLVVPAVAVQRDQEGAHVFVIKADRTAELRPVTL